MQILAVIFDNMSYKFCRPKAPAVYGKYFLSKRDRHSLYQLFISYNYIDNKRIDRIHETRCRRGIQAL